MKNIKRCLYKIVEDILNVGGTILGSSRCPLKKCVLLKMVLTKLKL
ncbi:MAG: hypothetical protein V8R62_08565 [Faecalibacillus intestinalis]